MVFPNHVGLCCGHVPTLRPCISQLADLLSPVERDRAVRFFFAADRERFIVAHGVLRNLLEKYTNCPARELELAASSSGKPYLLEPQGPCFSLAHAGDWIVCAFATVPVGVDIEPVRPLEGACALAEKYFSPVESQQISEAPEPERTRAFLRCWARKEAFLKATGEGLSRKLDTFSVAVAAGQANLLWSDRDLLTDWDLRTFELDGGYVGAVAANMRIGSIQQQLFTAL